MIVPLLGQTIWCQKVARGRICRLAVNPVTHRLSAIAIKESHLFGHIRTVSAKPLVVRPDGTLSLRLSQAQFDRLPYDAPLTIQETLPGAGMPIVVPMGGVIWPMIGPLLAQAPTSIVSSAHPHWLLMSHAPVMARTAAWGTLKQALFSMPEKQLKRIQVGRSGFPQTTLDVPVSWISEASQNGIVLKLDAWQVDLATRYLAPATP